MWRDPAEAFKELDVKEHAFLAEPLAAYLSALMKAGFTRREAFKLVESYSQFIYNLTIEDFVNSPDESDTDVDPEDEEGL